MLDQVESGQSKIATPSGDAMEQPEQTPSMKGKISKTGLGGAVRTAGRIVGYGALVALPVTAIALISRSAASRGMPMMAPGMGMGMPGMGMGMPGMGMGMPGMGMGMPGMGMGMPQLLNGVR